MKCSSISCNYAVIAVLFLASGRAIAANDKGPVGTHESSANIDVVQSEPVRRSVLDESFRYHRHGELPKTAPGPTIAPVRGSYRYGFPVHTHRWGWFGAQHYYPRVLWHHGYYGDHSRWSYRRGY